MGIFLRKLSWCLGHLEPCAEGFVNIFKNLYRFVSNFIMRYIVVCEGIEILGDFLLNFLWYVSTLCFIFSNRNTHLSYTVHIQTGIMMNRHTICEIALSSRQSGQLPRAHTLWVSVLCAWTFPILKPELTSIQVNSSFKFDSHILAVATQRTYEVIFLFLFSLPSIPFFWYKGINFKYHLLKKKLN